MVVQGAQVWQTQEQLWEERAVVWAPAGDERAQGFDQVLLQLLHRCHVHDARAIWTKAGETQG